MYGVARRGGLGPRRPQEGAAIGNRESQQNPQNADEPRTMKMGDDRL